MPPPWSGPHVRNLSRRLFCGLDSRHLLCDLDNRRLFCGLGFRQAERGTAIFPDATSLHELDALKTLEHTALGTDGFGLLETWMLRHGDDPAG